MLRIVCVSCCFLPDLVNVRLFFAFVIWMPADAELLMLMGVV
jgi:hypothetical protein